MIMMMTTAGIPSSRVPDAVLSTLHTLTHAGIEVGRGSRGIREGPLCSLAPRVGAPHLHHPPQSWGGAAPQREQHFPRASRLGRGRHLDPQQGILTPASPWTSGIPGWPASRFLCLGLAGSDVSRPEQLVPESLGTISRADVLWASWRK